MKRVGTVVGVCSSQIRADPKTNVGKGFLRKGYNYLSDSILPKEGIFCKVLSIGEVKIGDFIEIE